MDEIKTLVKHEYRKLFARKLAWVAFAVIGLAVVGVQVMTLFPRQPNWDNMVRNRESARNITGRRVNAALFDFAGRQNADLALRHQTAGTYFDILQWRPRAGIGSWRNTFSDFYESRRYYLLPGQARNLIEDNRLTEECFAHMLRQDARTPTPWTYAYIGGYRNFFDHAELTVIILFFAVTAFLAPLFAGEYGTGMAQMLLATKHGRGKLAWAKLITAVTFSAGVGLLFLTVAVLVNLIVFGFDGGLAIFQLYRMDSVHRLNLLGATLLFGLNVLARTLLVASVVSLLSAKLKTAFGTVAVTALWVVLAAVFVPPFTARWQFDLYRAVFEVVPSLSAYRSVFSNIPYRFGPVFIPSFVLEPIVSLGVASGVFCLAGRVFKRHQV